jgi:hypothetical protein
VIEWSPSPANLIRERWSNKTRELRRKIIALQGSLGIHGMMLFSLLLGVEPTQRWHPLDSHIRRQSQTEMMPELPCSLIAAQLMPHKEAIFIFTV